MDFLDFERRIDPGGDWFSGRLWRHFDEAFWVGLEGTIRDSLARVVDFVGLALMELVRRHQADAGVVMVANIPIEKVAAVHLYLLDASEGHRQVNGIIRATKRDRDRPASCGGSGVCDLFPGRKGSGTRSAMIGDGKSIAGKMEKIGDLIVYRQKFLHLPWRFEPLHDS